MYRILFTLSLSAIALVAFATPANAAPKVITDAMRKAAEKAFDAVDTNHDGALDLNEFTALLKRIPGVKVTPARAKQLFNMVDTDRNGKITKKEIKKIPEVLVKKGGLAKGVVMKIYTAAKKHVV